MESPLTTVSILTVGSLFLTLPVTADADITINGLVEPASVTTGAVSETVFIGPGGVAGTLTVDSGSSLIVNNVNGPAGIVSSSGLGSLVVSNAGVQLHARKALDISNGANALINNGSQVFLNGSDDSNPKFNGGRGLNVGSSPGTSIVRIDGAGTRVDIIRRINLGGFSGGGVGQLALSNGALVVHDGRDSSLLTSFVIGSNGSTGELFIDSGSTIQSIVPLMLVGVGTGTGFVDLSNSSLADLTTGLTVGGGNSQGAVTVTNSTLIVRADPTAPAFLNSGSVLVADLNSATVGTIAFDSNAVGDIENNLYISYLGGGAGHGSGQVTVCNSTLTVSEVFVGENGTLAGTTVIGNVTVEGGSIEPGCSPGQLSVDGNVTFNGGELIIELTDIDSYDVLAVTGVTDLRPGTTVRFAFQNGFAPSAGDSFDFLDAAQLILPPDPTTVDFLVDGLLDDFEFVAPSAENGFQFEAITDGVPDSDDDGIGDGLDNCTEVPNPDQRDTDADGYGNICDGDFGNDCSVNFEDLGQMKSVFFQAGDLDEDMSGDFVVNFIDLGLLKIGFFMPPGPSGVTNACGP